MAGGCWWVRLWVGQRATVQGVRRARAECATARPALPPADTKKVDWPSAHAVHAVSKEGDAAAGMEEAAVRCRGGTVAVAGEGSTEAAPAPEEETRSSAPRATAREHVCDTGRAGVAVGTPFSLFREWISPPYTTGGGRQRGCAVPGRYP